MSAAGNTFIPEYTIINQQSFSKKCLFQRNVRISYCYNKFQEMHEGFLGGGGSAKCLGYDFRGSQRNFTIRQSPKIWGIFQKYDLKLIKL